MKMCEELANESGPGHHTARVTADGTTLAFESERSLTGYNNQRPNRASANGVPRALGETGKCREVYLYDATASLATEAALRSARRAIPRAPVPSVPRSSAATQRKA